MDLSLAWQALLLTFLAGMSTAVGSLAVVVVPRSRSLLAQGMAFSAGAMIAVSFVELLGQAIDDVGTWSATGALLLGSLFTFGLDLLSPQLHRLGLDLESGHGRGPAVAALEAEAAGPAVATRPRAVNTTRVAVVATLAVALHNFPEGFAVFAGAYQSLQLGAVLTIAIAAHNIPEGMAVAAPVLHATNDRAKAFWAGTGSGLFEPLGAVFGALLLAPVLTPSLVAVMLAFVAGVMVYVSLDELLPAAREQAQEHEVALSLIVGIALMLATLAVLSP
ncbi:MAG TPA: ZIP family metal transporter [Dehalococcoidia bacterium]